MNVYCTRPGCPRPLNSFADLDDPHTLKTVPQKFCMACGMPLILDGRYVPLKLLGQGGFGAAFLACDRRMPNLRKCVVKQFQPSGDLNPSQLAIAQSLFEREGEVLAELGNNHPQIPDLFAFFSLTVPGSQSGKQSELFYLVQEFVDGQDMEEELTQRGALPEAEVRGMLLEILKVLQFVHDNGSIHRDIKPSNIMRHRTNGRYYLLDFGAVKQVTKVPSSGSKASTGIYSMGFAPPEQMSGGEVYPSTDLYALAVTGITLLTGKQPTELFDAYNNRWNWHSYALVNADLAQALDRMLLPAPNQRFASATEAIAALTPSPPTSLQSPVPHPQSPAKPPRPSAIPTPVLSRSAPPASGPPPATAPAITPPLAPAPAPVPSPPPPQPRMVRQPNRPSFSLWEILGGAAFTGFEGGLLAIALTTVFQGSFLGLGLTMCVLGGLVFALSQRLIEKLDLPIIAAITVAILYVVPMLQYQRNFLATVILAGIAALVAITITTLFRLMYNLLSRLM